MPVWVGDSIYIHMPKTGGTWVLNYLYKVHRGKNRGVLSHAPASTLSTSGHFLWGTIRDPWSWYLSWWAYGMKDPVARPRLASYGAGSLEFRDVLQGALARDEKRLPEGREPIAAIWNPPSGCRENERSEYLNGPGGLYSWAFRHIFGDLVKTFVEMRHLYEGVEQIFDTSIDRTLYPPVNTCRLEPKPTRAIYDSDMIDAVREADKDLIDLFGYEPFTALPEPVSRIGGGDGI